MLREKWRHKKGGIYTRLGRAVLQSSGYAHRYPLKDGDHVEVYENEAGQLFVRAESEFHDGRFTLIRDE